MSFLRRLFGRSGPLTPESLGEWLVGQQRQFFNALLDSSRAETKGLPPLDLSTDAFALADVSCNAWAIQVAVVAFTYHQLLDDSRFLSGGSSEGTDIQEFLTRIQIKARDVSKPYVRMNTPSFDPLPIAGCIVDITAVLPKILLCYSSVFMRLEPLTQAEPEAVRFATALVQHIGTANPLVGAMALAYFFGFKKVLTDNGTIPVPDPRTPDVRLASIMLRTWGVWSHYVLTFQKRLQAFDRNRQPSFD